MTYNIKICTVDMLQKCVLILYRFTVTTKDVSLLFNKYVKILSKVLKPLIVFYDRNTVGQTLPTEYNNYKRLRCLIDCSEIMLQKPTDLRLQAATWSDYKHHNTLKFLVAVTPQGSVAYLSQLWGGRTSDRHIVRNSKFYNISTLKIKF